MKEQRCGACHCSVLLCCVWCSPWWHCSYFVFAVDRRNKSILSESMRKYDTLKIRSFFFLFTSEWRMKSKTTATATATTEIPAITVAVAGKASSKQSQHRAVAVAVAAIAAAPTATALTVLCMLQNSHWSNISHIEKRCSARTHSLAHGAQNSSESDVSQASEQAGRQSANRFKHTHRMNWSWVSARANESFTCCIHQMENQFSVYVWSDSKQIIEDEYSHLTRVARFSFFPWT